MIGILTAVVCPISWQGGKDLYLPRIKEVAERDPSPRRAEPFAAAPGRAAWTALPVAETRFTVRRSCRSNRRWADLASGEGARHVIADQSRTS